MATCKNYKTDNGDKWVVGGTIEIPSGGKLDVKSGATVSGLPSGAEVFTAVFDTTTFAQAKTAYEAGKVIMIKCDNDAVLPATVMFNEGEITAFLCTIITPQNTTAMMLTTMLDSEDGWGNLIDTWTITPSPA